MKEGLFADLIRDLNTRTDEEYYLFAVKQRLRLEQRATQKTGNTTTHHPTHISPLLRPSEMELWLSGFIAGKSGP